MRRTGRRTRRAPGRGPGQLRHRLDAARDQVILAASVTAGPVTDLAGTIGRPADRLATRGKLFTSPVVIRSAFSCRPICHSWMAGASGLDRGGEERLRNKNSRPSYRLPLYSAARRRSGDASAIPRTQRARKPAQQAKPTRRARSRASCASQTPAGQDRIRKPAINGAGGSRHGSICRVGKRQVIEPEGQGRWRIYPAGCPQSSSAC